MARFKVRYRKIVTAIRCEGEFECLIEAETAQRAKVRLETGDHGFGTIIPKTERKTVTVLGADTESVRYNILGAEEVK